MGTCHCQYSRSSEQRYGPVSSDPLSCAVRLLAAACVRRPRARPAPAPTPGAGKAGQPLRCGGDIADQDDLVPLGVVLVGLLPRQHVQQGVHADRREGNSHVRSAAP